MTPNLPLPPAVARLLLHDCNASLRFNFGVDTYDDSWRLGTGKRDFIAHFITEFHRRDNPGRKDFLEFLKRRRLALEASGARPWPATSSTRLVVGLGLPHPTETGFLLDRLSGCPYIPGSSVKGLLRATARLAAKPRLAGEPEFPEADVSPSAVEFWALNLARVFGPSPGQPGYPAQGKAIFYDVFPSAWPVLDLDVLTPHYDKYYADKETRIAPGDWFDPVPVPFLTVASGQQFLFWFRGTEEDETKRAEDERQISGLIKPALDWIGLGGKRAAGYGFFDPGSAKTPAAPARVATQVPAGESRPGAGHRRTGNDRVPRKELETPAPIKGKPLQAEPVRTTRREIVTLLTDQKNCVADVATTDGHVVRCSGFSGYAPRKAGARCLAVVTLHDGVTVTAVFKRWE